MFAPSRNSTAYAIQARLVLNDDASMTTHPGTHWSGRARRTLHQAFEEQRVLGLESELIRLFDRLLMQLFPNEMVVVYQRAGGFDRHKLQHAFIVETFLIANDTGTTDSSRGRVAVVKIGVADNIRKEVEGWCSVCPPGFGNDAVLLGLGNLEATESDSTGRDWKAVLYEDANQKIGATEIVTLESTILAACRTNSPTCLSVSDCILDVFHRLHQHFYSGAVEENITNTTIEHRIVGLLYPPHSKPDDAAADLSHSQLAARVSRWRTDPVCRRTRLQANQLLREFASQRNSANAPLQARDPIQAIDDLIAMFSISGGVNEEAESTREWLADGLPPLMRGKTHGDLHGRNILVGLYEESANFPVVFDYEHTGAGKLIAWDFIKLEFETKIRVHEAVLGPLPLRAFGQAVIRFEQQLWDGTEKQSPQQPVALEPAEPLDRLRSLLLTLRRRAAFSLGTSQARTGDWLEEYKFLCAVYAATSSRYAYSERQRLASLLSAGIANGRSRWNERMVQWDSSRWQAAMSSEALRTRSVVGWEQPFAIARGLHRSGQPQSLEQAKEILSRLVTAFPHIPQPWEDLALICLDQQQSDEADRVLTQALRSLEPTEELLCRFGRIEKNRGNDHLDQQNWAAAEHHYERAFAHYQRAHQLNAGHYPAINMSSVRLYQSIAQRQLGHNDRCDQLKQESRDIAQRLLDTRATWPIVLDNDTLWHLATEAEAYFLIGNEPRSTQLYNQVANHPLITPSDWNSIELQRARNLKSLQML